MKKIKTVKALNSFRDFLIQNTDPARTCIRICMTGCRAYGAEEVRDALKEEINIKGLEHKVEIRETGCHGFCAKAPVMVIDPQNIFYQQVASEDIPQIVSQTIIKGKVVERLVYNDAGNGEKIPYAKQIPFYKEQTKRILANCGKIDPTEISHYIIEDGYTAFCKAVTDMTPDQVIETVEKSKLRGRGGAGFPTGRKWRFVREAAGDLKYIVCNADEGDPGAFMDRAVLEGDPHSVLEGMLIAAYAIGARTGYIYCRAEYPIAVEHLKIA
ncbi:MAG: NAD(P)H-dependent oxidoreductase subunit E, partial [Thermodesulfobacteriota bacterium]|nr:NAD(P)H-dependent oxidoreductase subunit E [Thermodesulfobacteriota bacterium]